MNFLVGCRRLAPALLALLPLALAGCGSQDLVADPEYEFVAKARNIILFIGDGMGEGPRSAARWAKVGPQGKLAMDEMPASGWSRTRSAGGGETDSAAGATAIATGTKTTNGAVSVDPQVNAVTTILEVARSRGKAVGLVTTTQLTDATPAAFAAHAPSRGLSDEIAAQMIQAGVDVLLGGGEDKFLPSTESGCYPAAGERQDRRNLIAEAQAIGYRYLCRPASLAQVDPAATPRLLGLFADGLVARPPDGPSLAEMTRLAMAILSADPQGFFLMVEGGLIDKAGHGHHGANSIQDTIALDEAVAVAREFAAGAPETLIIVAADHDTGGLDLHPTATGALGEQGPFYTPEGVPFYLVWTESGHTTRDVPVTAQGPSSDAIQGTFENTYLFDVMLNAME